jgi:broad specificity phosphatase PhoE
MKKLYYVRHGLTQGNIDEAFSGQIETPLTEVGKRQAVERGQAMKKNGTKIDLIISSPLSRAQHTARLIAKEIGYPVDRIEVNPLFLERNFGVLEGTPNSDFFKDKTIQDLDKVEGAETVEDLHNRAHEALRYLRSIDHNNILVVSHGTFGRALNRAVNNLPHTHEYEHEIVRIGNAELIELI